MKKRLMILALVALAAYGAVACGRNSSDTKGTQEVPSLVQRTAATNATIAQVSR